jgi:HK97 family phage portal protein
MSLTQPALRGDVVNYSKRDNVERIVLRSRASWLERTVRGMKALASVTFTRSTTWTFGSAGTRTSAGGGIDYTERAGDGRGNAIVFAALDLLSTTFAQSPLQVKQIVGDQQNVVSNHELVRRMAKPNDFYSGKLLWKATIIDYAFGNAYWLKVRSGAGKPVQFYWVPSTLIEPAWPADDATVFISHYDYNPNGTKIRIPVQDVVHFRNGLDPKNIRKGLSPLGALLREIATDEEAAEFTNTILRNLGVAGMVISPATDKGKISTPDAERIKAQVMQRTTGDRRGEPLVIGGAVSVANMGQDMSKLDVAGLRHLPEERITAIFGTPAVLLGLGTGLENATFSNVDGLRRIFYENKVIPTQSFIASDVHTQLVPDFEANVDGYTVAFDNEDVRVLKEDENELVTRLLKELEGGGMTLNEYRSERNREPVPDDMYMLSTRITPVAVADIVKKATVADATQNTGTGTGDTTSTDNSGTGGSGGGSDGGNTGDTGTGATGNDNGNKSAVHTKDIGNSVDRIRARMQGQCKRDVQGFLSTQRDFVLAQVEEQNKARSGGSTKVRINWPRLQEDIDTLKSALEPWYKRVLVAVHDVVQDVLDTRYELSSTDERTYLKSAALNIRSINEYTRSAVADAVATSVALDETADELATRIKGLHVFSDERATLIAGVELATATNLAQIESYKASDVVVGMLITDGDHDDVCKALDGAKVKISEARSIPPLGHPHCVRRFWHITDASEFAEGEAA